MDQERCLEGRIILETVREKWVEETSPLETDLGKCLVEMNHSGTARENHLEEMDLFETDPESCSVEMNHSEKHRETFLVEKNLSEMDLEKNPEISIVEREFRKETNREGMVLKTFYTMMFRLEIVRETSLQGMDFKT